MFSVREEISNFFFFGFTDVVSIINDSLPLVQYVFSLSQQKVK